MTWGSGGPEGTIHHVAAAAGTSTVLPVFPTCNGSEVETMGDPLYGDLVRRVSGGVDMGRHVVVGTDVLLEQVEPHVDAGLSAAEILDRLRSLHTHLPSLETVETMRTARDAHCRRHRIGRFDPRRRAA